MGKKLAAAGFDRISAEAVAPGGPLTPRSGSALASVVACLSDPDEQVRAATASTLHQLQSDSALNALMRSFMPGPLHTELVLRGAVTSLARWLEPVAVLSAFKQANVFGKPTAKQRHVRAAACEVLGHLFWVQPEEKADAVRRSETLLAHKLLVPNIDDADEHTRLQAVWAVGKLARREGVVPLLPLLKDPSVLVVEAAVQAIERSDWSEFLREGEEVLMAGPTLKRAMGGGAHPKFLMLTTAPRLFYVDVASSTPKELSMHAAATSKATLQVVRKNRKVRLQCVIHSAEAWQREISKAPIA